LNVLDRANKSSVPVLTKSGFMVGLGESKEEVLSLMQKLREVEVDIVTIGQYMQPSKEHYPVKEYVHPDVFKYYQEEGEKMGFQIVESAPLVRSSYHAEKARKLITKS